MDLSDWEPDDLKPLQFRGHHSSGDTIPNSEKLSMASLELRADCWEISLSGRANSISLFSMLDTGVETGFKWGHEADCFTEADATKASNASPSINPLRSSMMRTVRRWCGMTT